MPFWDGMWGPGSWFPVLPSGFMILCMIVMAAVMMYAMGMGPFRGRPRASALDILNERLASGDIDRTEYERSDELSRINSPRGRYGRFCGFQRPLHQAGQRVRYRYFEWIVREVDSA